MRPNKPLGHKTYGSIPHLPGSRLGPGDHTIHKGQADIVTKKCRKGDTVIVQEKADGSNCGIALLDGEIIPLGRAGYPASSSRFEQHRIFARWVRERDELFRSILKEGEWLVGEWLAQAHGTIYEIPQEDNPFLVFDLFSPNRERSLHHDLVRRLPSQLLTPILLHVGEPISIPKALEEHRRMGTRYLANEIEGVVYRVEREGRVDFLCKYVRPDKVDGKYLEVVTGDKPVWNWKPQ